MDSSSLLSVWCALGQLNPGRRNHFQDGALTWLAVRGCSARARGRGLNSLWAAQVVSQQGSWALSAIVPRAPGRSCSMFHSLHSKVT